MEHSPGFLKLVNEARPAVKEISIDEARERLGKKPQAVLMDVREDNEWEKGHATQAMHLGKGILERDLESKFPDPNREIIMYCGGGYRSILTAVAGQKNGFPKVFLLKRGYKGLLPTRRAMKNGLGPRSLLSPRSRPALALRRKPPRVV